MNMRVCLQEAVNCIITISKGHSPNTTEMYGDGPTTDSSAASDEVGLPPIVYMVRPTSGAV